MKTLLLVALIALCAPALAGGIDPNDAAAIQAAVKTNTDNFTPVVLFTAPQVDYNFDSGHFLISNDDVQTDISIGCLKAKPKCNAFVDVTVNYEGADWRFINSASLEGGKSPKVRPINQTVIDCDENCQYSESVSVTLPDGFLKAHAATGFKLKVGWHVYAFTGPYIQGLLNAVAANGTIAKASPAVATGVGGSLSEH